MKKIKDERNLTTALDTHKQTFYKMCNITVPLFHLFPNFKHGSILAKVITSLLSFILF